MSDNNDGIFLHVMIGSQIVRFLYNIATTISTFCTNFQIAPVNYKYTWSTNFNTMNLMNL